MEFFIAHLTFAVHVEYFFSFDVKKYQVIQIACKR